MCGHLGLTATAADSGPRRLPKEALEQRFLSLEAQAVADDGDNDERLALVTLVSRPPAGGFV